MTGCVKHFKYYWKDCFSWKGFLVKVEAGATVEPTHKLVSSCSKKLGSMRLQLFKPAGEIKAYLTIRAKNQRGIKQKEENILEREQMLSENNHKV